MNDMINGTGKLPPRLPMAQVYKPRPLPEAQLRKMNHAEWLEMFSQILGLQTGVEMTAKREGTITRLYWASAYVKLLEDEIAALKLQLRSEAEPKAPQSPLVRTRAAVEDSREGEQDVDDNDLRRAAEAEPDDSSGGTGNR